MAKDIAYYDPKMNPSPTTPDIDGMWITREEPYIVTRVWMADSERPRLKDEPSEIQAYAARRARELFDFKPIRKRTSRTQRV